MAQILAGETFTDIAPGKTVTSGRLNNHINGAQLLNGAVIDQVEKVVTVPADTVLLGDSTLAEGAAPKKVQLTNLLPETVRQGCQQYAADTGGASAYAVALSPAATAYNLGMVVIFKAANASTGASTLNVNGLGVQTIKTPSSGDLAANDIAAGQVVEVVYDGTYFQMLNASAAGSVTAANATESFRSGVNQYAADTGAANACAVALTPAATAYAAGMVVRFKAAATNTGATTLNVNALGNKAIKRANGNALTAGDIVTGQIVEVVYDGTNFQLFVAPRGWVYLGAATALTAANTKYQWAHGLGVVPTSVRAVLVCIVSNLGYTVGEEVDCLGAMVSSVNGGAYNVSADATNVSVMQANTATPYLINKTTPAGPVAITAADWNIKIYANP